MGNLKTILISLFGIENAFNVVCRNLFKLDQNWTLKCVENPLRIWFRKS